MRALSRVAFVASMSLGALGCGEADEPFADPGLSTSPFNDVSCATCHTVAPGAGPFVAGRYDSGGNLAGAANRPSWWGGYETRLLDAMNVCLEHFMGGAKLTPDDPRARRLNAYLQEGSAGTAQPAVSFTLVRNVTGLTTLTGDAARGRVVYDAACGRCHGPPHAAAPVVRRAPPIPEASIAAFPTKAREAVVEKVRHGKFFGIGGVMPLYSIEALSDQALADLLAHLGL